MGRAWKAGEIHYQGLEAERPTPRVSPERQGGAFGEAHALLQTQQAQRIGREKGEARRKSAVVRRLKVSRQNGCDLARDGRSSLSFSFPLREP